MSTPELPAAVTSNCTHAQLDKCMVCVPRFISLTVMSCLCTAAQLMQAEAFYEYEDVPDSDEEMSIGHGLLPVT